MVDATGTTSWTYDNADEVTELSTPEGTVDYTYEDSLRRHTMVETGVGTTTYGYDSDGHLTSLENPFSETTDFTYDDAGRLTQKTFASGAYDAYGYDTRNRVTSIDHKKSDGTVLSSESYGYDNAGNLTSKTVDGTETDYTYDDIDQLLSESRTGYSASYTYDANGNRASKTLNGVTDTYTNNNVDELTSITEGGSTIKSYTYDNAGRTKTVTTSAGETDLDYDYEGRLTQITYPDTSTNTFAYNGLDTRVSKTDSSGTDSYMRDGVDVTDPVINDGTANYTPGISERRSSTTKFVHSDQLGSMTALSDSSQAVTDTRQYDAFGMLVSSTGSTAMPFGFAGGQGYQSDNDSGLMLLGHRYYDPASGRFITRDPIKDGRNWYAYCDNNPLARSDGSGNGWRGFVGGLVLGIGIGILTAGNPIAIAVAVGVGTSLGDAGDQAAENKEVNVGECLTDGAVAGVTTFVGGAVLDGVSTLIAKGASKTLQEASPAFLDALERVKAKCPDHWDIEPADRGSGVQIKDPANPHNSVRLDEDDINGLHVHVNSGGSTISRDGTILKGQIDRTDPMRHIPFEDWLKWQTWNRK